MAEPKLVSPLYQVEVQYHSIGSPWTFGPFIKIEDTAKALLSAIAVGARAARVVPYKPVSEPEKAMEG